MLIKSYFEKADMNTKMPSHESQPTGTSAGTTLDDAALDQVVGARRLTEPEKWSYAIGYGTGIGAVINSVAAERVMPGGAKMFADAVYHDAELSAEFMSKCAWLR
jgi:hypothetical protein